MLLISWSNPSSTARTMFSCEASRDWMKINLYQKSKLASLLAICRILLSAKYFHLCNDRDVTTDISRIKIRTTFIGIFKQQPGTFRISIENFCAILLCVWSPVTREKSFSVPLEECHQRSVSTYQRKWDRDTFSRLLDNSKDVNDEHEHAGGKKLTTWKSTCRTRIN